MAYKYHIGQPFVYPRNDLGYAANFLHMCFAVPCEDYKVNPVLARAMDRIFILTRRPRTERIHINRSSRRFFRSEPVCLHCGRHCLPLGPRAWRRQRSGAEHAFRNRVCRQLIPEYVERAKDKDDPFRLMGFGHRVYKNYDPRARIMQKTTHEVLGELGIKDDPLLDVADRTGKNCPERMSISSRRNSIRISTSIRASRFGLSVSRQQCSQCCSRWRARLAGSRSGRRWSKIPPRGLAVRASSTPVRPNATTTPIDQRR